jgi:hypothetical protein
MPCVMAISMLSRSVSAFSSGTRYLKPRAAEYCGWVGVLWRAGRKEGRRQGAQGSKKTPSKSPPPPPPHTHTPRTLNCSAINVKIVIRQQRGVQKGAQGRALNVVRLAQRHPVQHDIVVNHIGNLVQAHGDG